MKCAVSKGYISLCGTRVGYTVRRNPRARRIWVKVEDSDGLVLVLPPRVHASSATDIIRRHRDWIVARLAERDELRAQAPAPIGESSTVFYRGRPISLRVRNCACAKPSVAWYRNEVVVTVPRHEAPQISEVLLQSYRERAKEVFRRRIEVFSQLVRAFPKRVSIRDQKTRWGACTSRGTLTFNWRLILAPPAVLDYVVIHELCHLRFPNHGPRFWQAVAQICPQYENYKSWLRLNGHRLRVD